jgi:hypothetical protein
VLARRRHAELDPILLAVALDRNGRVTAIEVPSGYVYWAPLRSLPRAR